MREKTMQMRARQARLVDAGFLFVAAVVIVVRDGRLPRDAGLHRVLLDAESARAALSDAKDLNSAARSRNAFQRRADAGYIESVQRQDVEITKTKNEVTASASWTRKLPMVRQREPVLEFERRRPSDIGACARRTAARREPRTLDRVTDMPSRPRQPGHRSAGPR
jgi:hypothetical protein